MNQGIAERGDIGWGPGRARGGKTGPRPLSCVVALGRTTGDYLTSFPILIKTLGYNIVLFYG